MKQLQAGLYGPGFPNRSLFDAMAEPGCYFLVPQMFHGIVADIMSYAHGYQFVFDPRVTDISLKDSVTGETKGIIEGLVITGPASCVETI